MVKKITSNEKLQNKSIKGMFKKNKMKYIFHFLKEDTKE